MPEKDQEIEALNAIIEALATLDEGARKRVLSFASDRYNVTPVVDERSAGRKSKEREAEGQSAEKSASGQEENWDDFADLYYAFGPTTNSERLLVAAYWLQEVEGKDDTKSNQANALLRPLGEDVSKNAYREWDRLVNQKPRLVTPRGSGDAWKSYKLTKPGKKLVRDRIASQSAD